MEVEAFDGKLQEGRGPLAGFDQEEPAEGKGGSQHQSGQSRSGSQIDREASVGGERLGGPEAVEEVTLVQAISIGGGDQAQRDGSIPKEREVPEEASLGPRVEPYPGGFGIVGESMFHVKHTPRGPRFT